MKTPANLTAIRAEEEITEAGSLTGAITAVEQQIAHPVNGAHKRFMVRVLAVLVSRTGDQS